MIDHYVTFDPTESVARTHDLPYRHSRAQGYYVPIYQASRPRRRRMGRTLLWLVLLAGASWVLTGCNRCDGSKVRVGMEVPELIAVCGKPRIINHENDEEQWCYGYWFNGTYVYVEDGEITFVQWAS